MWQKVVNRAIVPLLFAVVVSVVAIDLTLYSVVHRKDVSALAIESEKGLISQYDDMFRRVGRAYDIDWLLLSAIARTESEFYSKAVSKAGAVGIMQVMPSVARAMGYEPELLYDPEICANVAAKILNDNNKMLRLPSSFDNIERLNFILACYNAGYSRVADARRLASHFGANADSWAVVATYLEKLSQPEFYQHEVVQSGDFYGSAETVAYVRRVMRYYKVYKRRLYNYQQ